MPIATRRTLIELLNELPSNTNPPRRRNPFTGRNAKIIRGPITPQFVHLCLGSDWLLDPAVWKQLRKTAGILVIYNSNGFYAGHQTYPTQDAFEAALARLGGTEQAAPPAPPSYPAPTYTRAELPALSGAIRPLSPRLCQRGCSIDPDDLARDRFCATHVQSYAAFGRPPLSCTNGCCVSVWGRASDSYCPEHAAVPLLSLEDTPRYLVSS